LIRTLSLILMIAAMTSLGACETTRGAVKDAKNVGNALFGG